MSIRKDTLIIILVFFILLAGCTNIRETESTQISGVTSVEDIFTAPDPETIPQVAMPSFNSVTGITSYGLPEFSLDEVGHYVAYEGGEMRLPYTFTYRGSELSRFGVAIMVFLDGQLQPFRTSENDTIQYVHILYPEEAPRDTELALDLIFTPITGQSGDVMDLTILSREYAGWEWGSDNVGLSGNSSSITTRLKFSQTPPEAALPEGWGRILAWDCSYTDATLAEYESWGKDSMNKLRTCVRIDGEGYGHHPDQSNQGFRYLYNVTEDTPMELTLELVNTSGVECSVVIFLNNEPVSTNPADLIYVDKTSGQRASISVSVDMSGFDGQSKVSAVIIPRNYFSTIGYTSEAVVDVVDTVEYYLFAERDWAEVMNQ